MPISALSPVTRGGGADPSEIARRSISGGSAIDVTPRHHRRKRTRIVSSAVSRSKQFLAGVLAVWLGCASQVKVSAQETPQSNWTSADAPCTKYNDLRKPDLGNIGVKIDAAERWAEGFRRALGFWNTVLAADFHEETSLDSCSVRILDAAPDVLNNAMVARSQLTEWKNFRGKIAVNPGAAKAMSSAEIYGTAVHELGHMLGLKHNASSQSIMYFLNVNGTEVLDRNDILDLGRLHKLRVATFPINQALIAVPIPMPSGSVSSSDGWADSPAYLDGRGCVQANISAKTCAVNAARW